MTFNDDEMIIKDVLNTIEEVEKIIDELHIFLREKCGSMWEVLYVIVGILDYWEKCLERDLKEERTDLTAEKAHIMMLIKKFLHEMFSVPDLYPHGDKNK